MAKKTASDPETLLRAFFAAEIAEEEARLDRAGRPARNRNSRAFGAPRRASAPRRGEGRKALYLEVGATACLLLLAGLPFLAPPRPSSAALLVARGLEEDRAEALLGRLGEAFSKSVEDYRASLPVARGVSGFRRFY